MPPHEASNRLTMDRMESNLESYVESVNSMDCNAEAVLITACVLARNEAKRLPETLNGLQSWTDEILVIDHGSTDGTGDVAREFGARVLVAPYDGPGMFDGLRNLAIEQARGQWLWINDADEHPPQALGARIRRLVVEEGDDFEAMAVPFRNFFCGRWIRHCGWWPGYSRPQLLKRGCFAYGERLHSGVEVNGRTRVFPADDPSLAIDHYSYDDIPHYLRKLSAYTDGEAKALVEDGRSHSWQAQLAHFMHDWVNYYDAARAPRDGMHGFVLAFMSAFYRYAARAKAWDLRRQEGVRGADDDALPGSVEEMLQFMLHCVRHPHERERILAAPFHPAAEAVPLVWRSPLWGPSGFEAEARELVWGLIAVGSPVRLAPEAWGAATAGLSAEREAALRERVLAPGADGAGARVAVTHTLAALAAPRSDAALNICRTMFETDRLPAVWVPRLLAFDRIWVPTEFHREAFLRSGIPEEKLGVIPGALDAAPFRAPAAAAPDRLPPGAEPFRFLSVFDWSIHKGWDVLLESFAREFGGVERERPLRADVGLVLKTWSSRGQSPESIRAEADAHLRVAVGRGLESLPNVHFWFETLREEELPAMYHAVQAYVLASRGEGWGRPLMEAMAAGLPTIATAWSGPTAFHSERVGYPLPCSVAPVSERGARELPSFAGHLWAEPDGALLRRLMARLVSRRAEGRRKGKLAARVVSRFFSPVRAARLMQAEIAALEARCPARAPVAALPGPRLGEPVPAYPPLLSGAEPEVVNFRERLGRPLRVRWEGDQRVLSSLALVNRELCLGLLESGDVELSLGETPGPFSTLAAGSDPRLARLFERLDAPLSGPPDLTIRHHFPPNWAPPKGGAAPCGKLAVMQPWEYAYLPEAWRAGSAAADAVWAYSRSVRDVYVRSGTPAEKVRLTPLGFDPELFQPDGAGLELPTTKRTRFLFVGGAIDRKGIDLALAAYLAAFTRADDVCLVVKDMGVRTFYPQSPEREAVLRAAADPNAPEILYLDADLTPDQLAALYRSCTCLVQPYRGEGFALPPLEAAACGVPSIVTAGGPTDDFLDERCSLRVPARRRFLGRRGLGFEDQFVCVEEPWQLEPDPEALKERLLWAYREPEALARLGAAARAKVARDWSWGSAVRILRDRIAELVCPASAAPVEAPVPFAPEASSRADPPRKPAGLWVEGRPWVSLCVIARNEAPRLGEMLASFAPFVGEIVVVDTGSTDGTPEIAREQGARVFTMPWPDCFSTARNASLSLARGHWILWADADDVLPPASGEGIVELLRPHLPASAGGAARTAAAYSIAVRIPAADPLRTESLVDHVKLFPNRPDLRFEHRIHEQILPAIRRAELPLVKTRLFVVHQNYDRSPEGQARKRARDERLLRLELLERPDHPFTLFNLGMTHLEAWRNYTVAAQYLERSIRLSHPNDSIVSKAHAMLTTARLLLGEYEAAAAANEAGRLHAPDDPELLLLAGEVYPRLNRMADARLALERLTARSPTPGRERRRAFGAWSAAWPRARVHTRWRSSTGGSATSITASRSWKGSRSGRRSTCRRGSISWRAWFWRAG